MVKLVKPVAGAVAGFAMCFGSTMASAASVPAPSAIALPMSISPFVALSAYGTVQSQSAVCASAVGSAGAAAATQAQAAPGQGCVLPLLDPAVAPVVGEAPVVAPVGYAPVAAGGFGFGIGAILAGLIAVAGLAAAAFKQDNGSLPINFGPGPIPISPS